MAPRAWHWPKKARDRNMTRNSWRRTAFTSINGNVEIAPDDWTLLDPSGEPLARLYKVFGGPQDGQWYWTVLIHARRQRRKRWNRIYSDGARCAGSLRDALTGNDARLMRRPGEDPWASVCTSAEEYNRAVALKAQRAARERERLGLVPEPEGPSPGMLRR
jgi:hypothetical protein